MFVMYWFGQAQENLSEIYYLLHAWYILRVYKFSYILLSMYTVHIILLFRIGYLFNFSSGLGTVSFDYRLLEATNKLFKIFASFFELFFLDVILNLAKHFMRR